MPGRVFCEDIDADGIPKSPIKWTLNHRLGVGERGSEIVSILCPSGSPRKSLSWGCPSPFEAEKPSYTQFLVERKTAFSGIGRCFGGNSRNFLKIALFLLSSFKSSSFSNVKQIVVKHSRRFSLFLSLSNWVFLFTAANEMLIELKGLPKRCFNWEIGAYPISFLFQFFRQF